MSGHKIIQGLKEAVAHSRLEKIHEREEGIAAWLKENAPERTDKYLDEDSEARFYWHAGYRSALADVRKLLSE